MTTEKKNQKKKTVPVQVSWEHYNLKVQSFNIHIQTGQRGYQQDQPSITGLYIVVYFFFTICISILFQSFVSMRLET